jgi:plastocyanin
MADHTVADRIGQRERANTKGGSVPMRRSRLLMFAVLAATTVLLAGACSSSSASSSSGAGSASGSGKITIGTDQANDHGTQDATGKSSFQIDANNDNGFYFNPTVLTGSANQSITLEIKNVGTSEHNFSIDSQHVNETIQPGGSEQVTVTFPASGTVEFYCSFHRSLGMVGELQVA